MEYLLLLGSSFLAATILPFFSEVILYSLLQHGLNPVILILVATLGNTAGAWVNWILGRYLLIFQNKKWFYFKADQIKRSQKWFQHYGFWTLLFAWLPIIGDPLTLVAGMMRVRWLPFIILVAAGKCMRYCFVAFLA